MAGVRTMKAAIFLEKNKIEIQDREVPVPKAGEALIRTGMCGICGTDVHIYNGELCVAKPPVTLGHEISGDIEKVGHGVKGFAVGDRVAVNPLLTCGQCEFCRRGLMNLCENPVVIGYIHDGGFARYLVAPVTHLHLLPKTLSHETGILVETLACVLNGYDRLRLQAGHSALILGAGTVGLLWNQLLKKSPVTQLLQTEKVLFRRNKAKILGADAVFDANDPELTKRIFERCPEGVDYIIDATGDAAAVEQAIPWVRKGGTFMIFGVCSEKETIRISPFEIYQRQMTIIASKMPPQTLDRSVNILASGHINVDEIVSSVLPLQEIESGFQRFIHGKDKDIKIAIDPWA